MTAVPPPPSFDQKPPRRRTFLWIGLSVLIPIVALATIAGLVLQARGWRAYHEASSSMLPTLMVGDHLFVDPDAYTEGRRPEYGDIIVFLLSPQAGFSTSADGRPVAYMKRVVGLPGDRLGFEGGVFTINGKVVPQRSAGEFVGPATLGQKGALFREQLPNGASYDILRVGKLGPPGTTGPYVVPNGAYFVLGDNRDNSIDSRSWSEGKGWSVPLTNIIGRANYIYWSGFERLGRIGLALK